MKKLFVYGMTLVLCVGAGLSAPRAHAAPALHRSVAADPPAGLWQEIDEASLAAKQSDRLIVPLQYRVFRVDEGLLADTLARAPEEFAEAATAGAGAVMTLPMPDGSLERFRIQESSIMEPALQARYPEIRTYIAQGIDDRAATVRFDRTPLGFHAQILSPNGAVYIDPYRTNDTAHYISYFKHDFVKPGDDWHCDVAGSDEADKTSSPASVDLVTGQTLRAYRLALACTGEYATAVCSHNGVALTVDNTFAAMTTSVNRVDGVYESELAIRMVLVANDTSIVYINASTDPYTNNNANSLLSQNQTTCDSVIGSANYDFGHVFSTAGGGLAALGVVCRSGQKAQGETGTSTPYGDGYDIDYVAHEMGHQFGANHSFNGTVSSCGGGNRHAATAYEPGSGSTIMAYAGICGSDDLQPHSDPYFHGISFDEIVSYTNNGSGNGCAVQTSTGNNEPAVDAGAAFTIPANTPFELTASTTVGDPNGDALTYCWEEFDLGPALNTNTDNGSSPIFRSFNPSTSPTRVFPKISNLVANTTQFGEVLPTTSRTMTYRCTARDNRAGGGGVNFDTTTVTSTTSAGPFTVTSPNTATTVAGGSPLNVTWNVANTNVAPVNTANVSILLSLDGGITFPVVLLANTPNDGSETITVPNAPTTTARIKVKGAGNVFFDISNANFTITAAQTGGDSAGIFLASSSTFFLRNANAPGGADLVFGFGASPSTFLPLVGDWDGNHTDTPGLYDPTSGFFFLKNSNAPGGADLVFSFGAGGLGFLPLRGDWDGDGVDTVGIYSPATGTFFQRNSNSSGPADIVFSFGPGGSFLPLAGDWNGDGRDTVGLYDPATGFFYLKNFNVPGPADLVFSFGAGGDTPIVGDWNLDGKDTVGVYLPATGTWFLRNTNTSGGADVVFGYGPAGATPLTGDWDGL